MKDLWYLFLTTQKQYLEGCFFAKNLGTSLYTLAFPGGKLNITNSYIAENYSPRSITGTFSLRGISLKSGDYCLSNCTFVKNYANDGGGVFSEAGSTLNCVFKENRAFTAGGVDVMEALTHFENCSFIANEGILYTRAVMGQSGAHLVIHNCLFESNHGINAIGAVGLKIQSKLTVLNSTFVNNTSDLRAGVVLLEKDVIAYISDSTFINNSAVHHGCINTNSNVTLQVSRTRFTGNIAKYAAVLFSEYDVKVQLFLSTFKHNAGENTIGGSKGGARDARPPWGSKFFHFHAVFGKNLKNNSNFGSWGAPGKILDPPLNTIELRQNQSLTIMNSHFSENNISSASVIFEDRK